MSPISFLSSELADASKEPQAMLPYFGFVQEYTEVLLNESAQNSKQP
jgi:hypothetical protein